MKPIKVLLLNGSPHQNGSTMTALTVVATRLNELGLATEIIQVGNRPTQDCIACGGCQGKNRCVFDDDPANEIITKLATADALVVGTPVYYAHPSGRVLSLLDRVFYAGKKFCTHKPAGAIAVGRRAGTTATLDVLNKYFTFAEMPVVASTYWNQTYASKPSDLPADPEGQQTLTNLAENLAWLCQSLATAKITPPAHTNLTRTNFTR